MKTYLLFFLLLTSLLLSENKPGSVYAHRIETPPELDGKLTEDIWKCSYVTNFLQKEPVEGTLASEVTKVKVLYDDTYLYVGADLLDTVPDSIDQSLTRRDNYVNSDWFYFFVDPFFDKRTGNFFAVNAGGSKIDGVMYNDSWSSDSWDGIWEVKAAVNDTGWSVEMKIPFSQLRFNEGENMVWGVNFNRDIKRKSEYDYYIMVPKTESGFVSRFAELHGINGIKSKQRVEFLPYVLQKASYLQHDSNDPFYKSNIYETTAGLDIKIGLGSNLNLDATINPDFGQVEVDPAVLSLSAFETFYDEKRPFFIEGADIFNFGFMGANNNWSFNFGVPELFYSRRVGRQPQYWSDTEDDEYVDRPGETRILGAAKLTGKLDNNTSIGFVSAATQKMYNTIQGPSGAREEAIEPFTHYGALRMSRQLDNDKYGIGIMATAVNRDNSEIQFEENLADQAYVFGVDGYATLDTAGTYVLNGAFAGSYVSGTSEYMVSLQERPYRYLQNPNYSFMRMDSSRTSLSGLYGRLALNKQKGNFYVNASVGMVTPGFENNDAGYQWMANRINGSLVLGYRFYEPDGIFRRKNFYVAKYNNFDFDGYNISDGYYGNTYLQFENYWSFYVNFNINNDIYSNSATRGGPRMKYGESYSFYTYFNTDSRKDYQIEPNFSYGEEHDGSYYYDFTLYFYWRPKAALSVSAGPGYSYEFADRQWVDSFEDPYATATFGNRYVFAKLTRKTIYANIRVNWSISPDLSIQWYVQPLFTVGDYNGFKEFTAPETDRLTIYDENNVVYNGEDEEYTIDPDGAGLAETFTVSDPDFNFKSIRSNMVIRWEVLPGSIFYLVWTHDKTNYDDPGKFDLKRDFDKLMYARPDNIFMAKFSYWLDI